jgi:hypothetical protein
MRHIVLHLCLSATCGTFGAGELLSGSLMLLADWFVLLSGCF